MTSHEKTAEELEERGFRRVLVRSAVIPPVLSLGLAGVFVALVLHLLAVNQRVDARNRVISSLSFLVKLTVDSETALRGYLLTGNPSFLEPHQRMLTEVDSRFAALRTAFAGDAKQLARLAELRNRFSRWLDYHAAVRELRERGGDYAGLVRTERGKEQMDAMRRAYDELLGAEETERDLAVREATETARGILLFAVLFTIVAGGLLSFFVRRQLVALAAKFGAGLRAQREQNARLADVAWLDGGQAQLATAVRGMPSIEELGQRAIRFLCEYTGAQVGRLFFRNDSQRLVAVASFAFDERVARVADSYSLGQGIVGQCASDGVVRQLSALPADYLRVSSGMGEAPVRFLVVVPLSTDDAVRGVVELGFFEAVSEQTLRFLRESGERLGHAFLSAHHRTQLQELLEETQRQSEELQAQHEELEATNEDLQTKSHELQAQQQHLEQANTEMERQQVLLEEANEELERSRNELRRQASTLETTGRYKSEFLANMSHELRTPLNSVLLLANLLLENHKQSLDAEDLEYARTIHSSASDLLLLINDILDLSKVEAGKLEINPEPLAMEVIASGLERMFRPQMERKGLQFHVTVLPGAPSSVETDRARCDQILRNLLSNALKFTERGSVTLEVGPGVNGFALSLAVIDTGIGIPREKQQMVFEAFQQADGTISRKFGGTGLGLTISRELTQLLGGVLRLSSEEGKGTRFELLLPASIPSANVAAKPAGPRRERPPIEVTTVATPETPVAENALDDGPAHGIEDDRELLVAGEQSILIIEDEPTFAKALFTLCSRKGFRCLVSANGERGLADAIRYRPSAILLDLHLPGLSGMGVLETLKRDSRTRHIPVHVVSVENRGKEVLRMGAVGFAEKPVTGEKLEELLERVIVHGKKKNKHLLLIEDNPLEQEGVRRLIGNGDVFLDVAATGKEALEKLRQKTYDCIVLDLKLPDMTGFELLARLDEAQRAQLPPVVVYTARDLSKEEKGKLEEVSESIVLKGARSPERLLDEVTLFLHRMEDRLSVDQKEMLQKVRHREEVFQGKKVLLVDDDMRSVFAMRNILLRRGFEVVIAKTGKEALERLAEHKDTSAVLMDVMMPEMDGLEATRRVREDAAFRELPIIALTAKAMKGDRERCLDAGASDYLPKPVDPDALLSLLRVWLTR